MATPPIPPSRPSAAPLRKKVREITSNSSDEPDLYTYVRDLLTRSTFGIGLGPAQVVIDSKIATSRRRPDLVVYRTENGRPLRGPDFAAAVFEVKLGEAIQSNGKAIAKEKRSYPQSGTRWFFLIDQTVVWRIDVSDPAAFDSALAKRGPLPRSMLKTWTWAELEDPSSFMDCFAAISSDQLRLETELAEFRANRTRYAFLDASGDKRTMFGATVRAASETVRQAVESVLLVAGVNDLQTAQALLNGLREDYGEPVFDWSNARRPIEFSAMLDTKAVAQLTDELVREYDTRLDILMGDLEPVLYALRIETDLLQQYAARQGVEHASLLALRGEDNKANKRLADSLVYETASLILSRMLTIRFCEDHDLFRVRYISNGGVEIFWRFADHFSLPMQELLRQSYKHAGYIFRSIFDANLLDWAIRRDDAVLSDALLRVAYILSRWNFRTVRGDILSGVYDQYLDVSQRRRLGEVYTRPEIARFMLSEAGFAATSTVLDPACGTGTFLVEALSQRLDALNAAGVITADAVREVVGRLHGLDISTFSVTLAQIQFFWHLIDVVSGKSAEEIRDFARSILPVLKLYGGWSSLDTLGQALDHGAGSGGSAGAQSGLSFRVARVNERKSQAQVPSGFERAVRDSYDIVVMNPPYIRAERAGSASVGDAYDAVTFKNTDASIFFIYRALQQWVKPGGTLAFIVPIGATEAAYAGPLRKVLGKYRIRLIADLEGLGKATFRGVKRATVIIVVDKVPASPEDQVEMLQLDPSALVNDAIDFTLARRSTIKRWALDRLSYLPQNLRGALEAEVDGDPTGEGATDSSASEELATEGARVEGVSSVPLPVGRSVSSGAPAWLDALRGDEGSADALLTKLSNEDVSALLTLRDLPRLGEIVRLIYVKRHRGRIVDSTIIEPTQERYAYRPELLFNYGVKLGGSAALRRAGDQDCILLYKGQNIFPQGLLGQPMGEWSPTAFRETTRYIYSYAPHLSYQRTFAAREISQLPTIARLQPGQGFQNTAYMLELSEDFPLHSYVLSRVIQFYAARILRSSILEDLGCHWYKRTLTLLPIPFHRSAESLATLTAAGRGVLEADSDIANRYRTIDALIEAGRAAGATIATLVVNGDPRISGIDLNGASEDGVLVNGITEAGDQVRSTDLFFSVTIPNEELRQFVSFVLVRRLAEQPDEPLSRDDVLELLVPTNLSAVVRTIRSLTTDNLQQSYIDALDDLDRVVAEQCGIPPEQRDRMVAAMATDPILSKMRPMIAQRGLRIQPYADHGEGVRYQ